MANTGGWRIRSGQDLAAAGQTMPSQPPARGTIVLLLRGTTHRDVEIQWSINDPSLSEGELASLVGEALARARM